MAAGLLYTKGKIPTLLSGILVMTSCHSIMLLIMGRANLGLLGTKQIQDVLPFDSDLNQLLTGLIFVSIVIALMLFFSWTLNSDKPILLQGIILIWLEVSGFILDAWSSWAGLIKWCDCPCRCPHCSARRLCRCVSRIGVIVVGLASLIIGEVIFKSLSLAERLVTIVVGSIAYQFLVWAVIALGFNTSYLRLYSALILAVCLMIPTFKQTILKGAKLSK